MGLFTQKIMPDRWQDWFLYTGAISAWRWISSVDWRLPALGMILSTNYSFLHFLNYAEETLGFFYDPKHYYPGIEFNILFTNSGLLSGVLLSAASITACLLAMITLRNDPYWRSTSARLALWLHLLVLGAAIVSILGMASLDHWGCELAFERVGTIITASFILLICQHLLSLTDQFPGVKWIAGHLLLAHAALLSTAPGVFLTGTIWNFVDVIK